jgi:ketosteroid isomerase-like protein
VTPIDAAKRYIHAVQTGDQAGLGRLISPEVVWHQPGRNRFSGTHHGVQDVVEMLGGMMAISRGSFRIVRANRYMENGGWVAIELEFAAERDGMNMAQPGVDLLRVDDGRIVEVRLFSSDPDAEDAFWGR